MVIGVEIARRQTGPLKVSVYGPTSSFSVRPTNVASPVVADTTAVPFVTVPAAVVHGRRTVDVCPRWRCRQRLQPLRLAESPRGAAHFGDGRLNRKTSVFAAPALTGWLSRLPDVNAPSVNVSV